MGAITNAWRRPHDTTSIKRYPLASVLLSVGIKAIEPSDKRKVSSLDMAKTIFPSCVNGSRFSIDNNIPNTDVRRLNPQYPAAALRVIDDFEIRIVDNQQVTN